VRLALKVEAKPMGSSSVIETQREIENMIDNMTRNVMRMTMNGLRKYAANRIVSEYATRDSKGQIMTFPKWIGRRAGLITFTTAVARWWRSRIRLIAEAVLGMETVGMEMWEASRSCGQLHPSNHYSLACLPAQAGLQRRTDRCARYWR
jgi:hypothetical protein